MSAGATSSAPGNERSPRSIESRSEQALRLYRRRVGRCATENQVNRLHIALENYMTPAEARFFGVAMAEGAFDARSREWIARLVRYLPVKVARPVEFERNGLCKGATRYTANAGAASDKTLIIGFAGHFHRLMLPMPWFLDCFNPALYDVVVLRDFPRRHYASGIPGLGDDFAASLRGLANRIDPHAYRNAVALGTSGGGLPALLAAILLELDRGIGIGAQDVAPVAVALQAHGLPSEPYASLLALRPRRFPKLVLAYGADNPSDAAAAAALHARVPSDLQPVKRCAQHTLLAWQLERGTLPSYLSKLLGQGLEGRDLLAVPRAATITIDANAR